MGQQKAVQINRFSNEDLKGLELIDRDIPQPKDGEVLVKVTLRPVNPTDILELEGKYAEIVTLPAINGSEAVGIVETDGQQFKKGDRVVAVPWPHIPAGEGTWQEYVAVQEQYLSRVPEGVSDEVAAQFFINPTTVYGMLDVIEIPEGKFLLQSAATSTLGRMLISYAKKQGVQTINVVRRSEAKAELEALGATHVIGSDKEDVVKRVREITGGEGAYAALECVGGSTSATILRAIRPGGTMYAYGTLTGQNIEADFFDLTVYEKTVSAFIIYNYIQKLDAAGREKMLSTVWDLLQDGTFTPAKGKTFALADYEAAIQHTVSANRGGKAFLK